jgi:DTW domain-containing protein YfiP
MRSERCPRCALTPVLCVCAALVPVAVPLRIVVVMHAKEAARPSNTGRLLPALLSDAWVVVRRGTEAAPEPFPECPGPVAVLFPDADARPLDTIGPLDPPPRTLLVPDGNWRQARRITRREPALAATPRVCLPTGGPPLARLRDHPDADRLATVEAVARALGALGHADAQAHLEAGWRLFAAAFERMRYGGA